MRIKRTLQRPIATLLLLIAAALLAVGCGNDDSSSEETTSTTETPATATTDEMADDAAAETDTADIVDTAVGAGSFSTLVAAVQAAELEETLRGDGPFTVFAPTDDAFNALPDGTVDDLLKPESRSKLTDVLTYHVVPSAAMAGDLTDGQKLTTVQGAELTVSIDGDTVKIGDATVTQADIAASNGVIHVIDAVLMPPS